jgi:CRISPR-associated protein Cmr3
MMQLFLEPMDVWLFRDGKPFDADGSRRAESMFPPYPSVIQGAIRTYELNRLGIDVNDSGAVIQAVGDAEDYKELRIRGPVVVKENKGELVRYYPQPADALSVDVENHTMLRNGAPQPHPEGVITNMPMRMDLIGLDDPAIKGESGLWLSEDELAKYILGQPAKGEPADRESADLEPANRKSADRNHVNNFFMVENRIGIGMDNARRAVKTGKLFEVGFIRPKPGVGLYVEIEGYTDWPESGILRLGGESRTARFRQVPALKCLYENNKQLGKLFNLYFTTPAYLKEGWTTNWNQFFTQPVRLLSAAVNRYESLGGFDYARKDHKPARRYIPAGSVYTFRVEGNTETQLHTDLITEYGLEIGFGQVIAYPLSEEEINYV